MGKVIVQDYTYKKPITMIGVEAGICWGANTSDDEKNYLRGIDCLESGHGRTFEFPDVYLTLEGYSARVIREWYTHIGGLPTRLQASTRYIDYEHGFGYVTPPSIEGNPEAKEVYEDLMEHIKSYLESLDTIGVPREDSLGNYSEEWKYIVDHYFMPKCKLMGFCSEKKTCGMMPRKQ